MISEMNLPVADAFIVEGPVSIVPAVVITPMQSSSSPRFYAYSIATTATAPVAPGYEQNTSNSYRGDRKVEDDGGDVSIPRSMNLPEQVFGKLSHNP
jgi:hypothetical protein